MADTSLWFKKLRKMLLGRHPHQERLKLNRAYSMPVLELRESIERGLKSKSAALMAFDFHIDPFFLDTLLAAFVCEPQRKPRFKHTGSNKAVRLPLGASSTHVQLRTWLPRGHTPTLLRVMAFLRNSAKFFASRLPGWPRLVAWFFFPIAKPGQWKSLCLPVARHCSCSPARAFSAQGAQR